MPHDAFVLFYRGLRGDEADGCSRTFVCASNADTDEINPRESEVWLPLSDKALATGCKKLYVSSLDLPDDKLDELIDYTLGRDAKLIVKCSQTLTEAGLTDARFGRSPVMLLHEFGLLPYSQIVSGVYLDKDDLSLLAQEKVPLVVLPTSDAGYGYGVAPVCAALERGVTVKIGTGDGAYNKTRNLRYECEVLNLLVSAQMNRRDAIERYQLEKMIER